MKSHFCLYILNFFKHFQTPYYVQLCYDNVEIDFVFDVCAYMSLLNKQTNMNTQA